MTHTNCDCEQCRELLDNDKMAHHMDFIGQRADKMKVNDVLEGDDPDGVVIVKNGIERELVQYTMSCPECGGHGYYEDTGEVICEDCGVVISGDAMPTMPTEYSDSDGIGMGRGLEKMPGSRNSRGTMEPSIE